MEFWNRSKRSKETRQKPARLEPPTQDEYWQMPAPWRDAKILSDERDAEFDRVMKEHHRAAAEMYKNLASVTMPSLRPATKLDYIRWLKIANEVGVIPTHFYDYRFPSDSFFVAVKDVIVCPAYGSMSINIIVLDPGIKVTIRGLGHNNIYYPDGGMRGGFVPMYSDIGGA